jgi:glutamyl-tRNA synthetase/glutamyl-Q tRNA(Asp) synthetase
MEVGRYAPSTTGRAHPGTLLAGLLCWLDARSRGARLVLRLEDLDPQRCRPEYAHAMRRDLAWIGLEWDDLRLQSEAALHHAAAIAELASRGLLYPCRCSRSDLQAAGLRAPDGGYRYPNTCRSRRLEDAGPDDALRVRIDAGRIDLRDESGSDLSQDVSVTFGDPVVRRRDGGIAYHLATVVDDAREGVTRVVRGRDLAPSTATQVALQHLLRCPPPAYRHHLLLLEPRAGAGGASAEGSGAPREKLAKLHGSVSAETLREVYDGPALCGVLAFAAGLLEAPEPVRPSDLLQGFQWGRVRGEDRLLVWDGSSLQVPLHSA